MAYMGSILNLLPRLPDHYMHSKHNCMVIYMYDSVSHECAVLSVCVLGARCVSCHPGVSSGHPSLPCPALCRPSQSVCLLMLHWYILHVCTCTACQS